MSNDKNWLERLVDRAAGLGEHDSHYNSLSEEEKDDLAKYAKDPDKWTEEARANMLERDAKHRSQVNSNSMRADREAEYQRYLEDAAWAASDED